MRELGSVLPARRRTPSAAVTPPTSSLSPIEPASRVTVGTLGFIRPSPCRSDRPGQSSAKGENAPTTAPMPSSGDPGRRDCHCALEAPRTKPLVRKPAVAARRSSTVLVIVTVFHSRAGRCPSAYRTWRGRARTSGSGGSGMNSASSPGGKRKRPCAQSPARQASLAASIRSRDEATKFHHMNRGPASVSPPSSISRAPSGPAVTCEPVARPKGHHLRRLEALAADHDAAGDHVEPAILVVIGKRHAGSGRELDVGVKHVVEGFHRGLLSPCAAEDQPRTHARCVQHRQRLLRRVLETGGRVFGRLGQRHPGLDAEERMRVGAGRRDWSVQSARRLARRSSS